MKPPTCSCWAGLLLFLTAVFILLPGGPAVQAATYTVQPGDSLYIIAQKFDTKVDTLRRYNDLYHTNLLYPGQALYVPSASPSSNASYTVQPGDSLYLIGQRMGVSVSALMEANGLQTTQIYPGQTLRVPTTVPEAGSDAATHTVQAGESLYLIAGNYGTTVTQLQKANDLSSSLIYPGQKLNIPGPATGEPNAVQSFQGRHHLSSQELDLLARLVRAEAEGEPYEGQVAVAAVVLNRVDDPRFPDTVTEVIHQPLAFETVDNGRIYRSALPRNRRAAEAAVEGWDPSRSSLYFWAYSKEVNPWVWSRDVVRYIGSHVFAR